MDNFVVSARKYRPTTFSTVVGQQSITQTLQNAIKNNHLASALLFCGPRGVGKTTCARILAKAINLSERDEEVTLDNSKEDFSFNIFELDAASNNSVEDIRNLIDQVRFPPQVGKFKVYIIDEVHMLSQAAFNAFLKTLEEPPKHAIFILATTEKHKIIPTILSRCQVFDFNRIQIADIANHLLEIAGKEGIEAEQDAVHIIAQKADGALRDALSMFDQIVSYSGNHLTYKAVIDNLNILDYDYYFKVADAIIQSNIPQVLLVFNEILSNGFDGHNFILGLEQHFRNLMVSKDETTLPLLEVGSNIKERYAQQARSCSLPFLLNALNTCNQCDVQYRNSKNQRLLVELSLMQLSSIVATGDEAAGEKKKGATIAPPSANPPPLAAQQSLASQSIRENPPVIQTIPSPVETNEHPVELPKTEGVAKGEVQPDAVQTQGTALDKNEVQEVVVNTTPAAPNKRYDPTPMAGKISGSFSINAFIAPEEKEKAEDGSEENTVDLAADPFSTEAFFGVWKTLAKETEDEGNLTLYSILSKTPELKEDFTVALLLDNKAQEEELEIEKTTLQERLRKELNNFKIQITTEINKDEAKKKAYTASEKFKKMADKNPHLNTLKDQLGLEINI
jgi:DNA polymerase-3 subunit gamma/tau